MPWLKEVCQDAVCGISLELAQGVFGMAAFTTAEVEEIHSFKKLALSTIEKSPEFTTAKVLEKAKRPH